jgi:hypothetical protein
LGSKINIMKNQINFFSQLDPSVPEEWQRQICGLACVKMIIDSNEEKPIDIQNLIKEGKLIEAYDPEINNGLWTHEGLVRILRNHGILSYAQEFRAVDVNLDSGEMVPSKIEEHMMQKGMEKIMRFAKKERPVIASVKAGFSQNSDSHLILIKGFKAENGNNQPVFIVNDPLVGEDLEISFDHFLKYWKKFVIFVS